MKKRKSYVCKEYEHTHTHTHTHTHIESLQPSFNNISQSHNPKQVSILYYYTKKD